MNNKIQFIKNNYFLGSMEQHSLKELPKSIKNNEEQKFSMLTFVDNSEQSEEENSIHATSYSKQSSVLEATLNKVNNLEKSQFQQPKCLTVQTSQTMYCSIPRVPTVTTPVTINTDEEDEASYNNDIKSLQYVITTNEQYEDIMGREERKPGNDLFLKVKFLVRLFYSIAFLSLLQLDTTMNNVIGLLIH